MPIEPNLLQIQLTRSDGCSIGCVRYWFWLCNPVFQERGKESWLWHIQVAMASLGFIGPPKNFRSPPKFRSSLDTKAPGPPLIYLVGPLAILDPHINICVGPSNTCVALKQFNLLPPNISVWSNNTRLN